MERKMRRKKRIMCNIDTDGYPICYRDVDAMTKALAHKYGVQESMIEYVMSRSSMCWNIILKSKLGDTMRMVGFYYEMFD